MKTVIGALRSGHWPSLAGAWLHFEVSFMAWLLIGGLGLSIAAEFGLTATQKGLLVAVPLLGGALLRVIVGASSDRFGPKSIGLALLGCECLALVWGWLDASSYLQVLGVGLLLGAAGASFAVALPLASRAYPPAHQGWERTGYVFCAESWTDGRLARCLWTDGLAGRPDCPAVQLAGS